MAVASLVLSIPSAALAVADLADRIDKRRRATELIDQAQHLTAQQITVCLMSRTAPSKSATWPPISSSTWPMKNLAS